MSETRSQTPELDVNITSMAFGGCGIARTDGKVLFVEDTVVGDRVRARITNDKGRYAEAAVETVLTRSPLRGGAPCEYIDRCGGCLWQDIPAEDQRNWKAQFVESALKRIGKIDAGVSIEVVASPELFHYRNRVHLKGHFDNEGHLSLGYYRKASHELVPIKRCMIAAEAINLFIQKLQDYRSETLCNYSFKLEVQEVNVGRGANHLVITLFPDKNAASEVLEPFCDHLQTLDAVLWADFFFKASDAPFIPLEEIGGVTLYTRPGLFQQVNIKLNQIVRNYVKVIVDAANPNSILDVFCGSGNLSLPLAQKGRFIAGVESSAGAIACAQHNVDANHLEGFEFVCGEADKHLWRRARAEEKFDFVIVDPPREGMFKGVVPLEILAPKDIIYVSCNPATLARDLSRLCRSTYRVESVKCFDFFPHTYHIETIVHLKRI